MSITVNKAEVPRSAAIAAGNAQHSNVPVDANKVNTPNILLQMFPRFSSFDFINHPHTYFKIFSNIPGFKS